jgi:hypothetical protein
MISGEEWEQVVYWNTTDHWTKKKRPPNYEEDFWQGKVSKNYNDVRDKKHGPIASGDKVQVVAKTKKAHDFLCQRLCAVLEVVRSRNR